MRKLILLAFVMIALPVLIAAQENTEENTKNSVAALKKSPLETQLENLYDRFLRAISEKDIETYRQMTTGKYVFTRGTRGEVLNKEQRIEQIKAEADKTEIYSITSAEFSIYENSAIGSFDLKEKNIYKETEYNFSLKTTVFFVKTTGEDWKIAAIHSTTVSY